MEMIFNVFASYKLSEEELAVGSSYNHLQLAVLQNRRAQLAQDLLALDFDPEHALKFTQDQAFLKGQLAFADWQIALANEIAIKTAEPEVQKPNPELS